jgi:hypothetical protein
MKNKLSFIAAFVMIATFAFQPSTLVFAQDGTTDPESPDGEGANWGDVFNSDGTIRDDVCGSYRNINNGF